MQNSTRKMLLERMFKITKKKLVNVLEKKLTSNVSCTYCCKKIRKCDCGICRDVNTKCKCTKKFSHVHFKKCRKEKKEKGVVQTKCCVFRRDCNGKKCRFHKLTCKWTGFERVSRVVFKCRTRKISKTASKRFCCKWRRTCVGLKCKNGKKTCKFHGLEITKKGCL